MAEHLGKSYLDVVAADIGALVPCVPPALLRIYAVLALAKGTATTLEDVHDAWVAYMSPRHAGNPALAPFCDLPPDVQEMGEPVAGAIRAVAHQRNGGGPRG